MQPAPGRLGLHSGLDSFRFNTNSSLSTVGSILRHNQCLSIAVCFQIRRYAVQALRCPGPALAPVPTVLPGRRIWVDKLYISSTNPQPSPPPERASASVASSWSAAAGAGGFDRLHDTLRTRIERAVHVGAHGKQALNTCKRTRHMQTNKSVSWLKTLEGHWH
jgi:hypothetical protein